jgi:hypothetical protein
MEAELAPARSGRQGRRDARKGRAIARATSPPWEAGMPIFLDRHDLSGLTAEDIAEAPGSVDERSGRMSVVGEIGIAAAQLGGLHGDTADRIILRRRFIIEPR